MTVFTVNPFDDGYFVDGKPVSKFQQLCMRSWKRLGYEIKVFDYSSPEVVEAKEKYKLWVDSAVKRGLTSKFLSIASDAIRLYILSLYDDLLYFDTDIYVADPTVLKELENETSFKIRGHNFCAVHNGKRKDIAKKILDECYMTNKTKGDKQIIESSDFCLSLPSIQNKATWLHCPRIGDKNWYNFYIENIDEFFKYQKEKNDKKLCFYSSRQTFLKVSSRFFIGKKNEQGEFLYDLKLLSHIPAEDFDEFRSFMDN